MPPADPHVAGRQASSRRLLGPPLAVAAAVFGASLATAAWDPHTHHLPLCPFHAMTGLWCPLCGSLRSVFDVSTGHIVQAMSDNALLIFTAPFVLLWWVAWMRRAGTGQVGTRRLRIQPGLAVGFALLVIAYTVLRNLPVGSFLAPT